MFGKPGLKKKAAVPRFNYVHESPNAELGYLGEGRVNVACAWAELDGEHYRLPSAEPVEVRLEIVRPERRTA